MKETSPEMASLLIKYLYSGTDAYGNEKEKPSKIMETPHMFQCYFDKNKTSHSYSKNELINMMFKELNK